MAAQLVLPMSVKPGKKYRVIQTYANGTHVAVQGRVILAYDDYISFAGAGKFNAHSHVGMDCEVWELDD